MRTSLYDYCREHDLNDLLRQWHPSKNEPLTQQTVTYGSKRRIWLRCDHGHEWQAAVYTRTGVGTGCPVCAGRIQPARVERYRRMAAERERERLWDTLSHRAENKSLGETSK